MTAKCLIFDGWLVVFNVPSAAKSIRDTPFTVTCEEREAQVLYRTHMESGRCVADHYTTAAPRKLLIHKENNHGFISLCK